MFSHELPFHQSVENAAFHFLCGFKGNLLLKEHKIFLPLLFDPRRDLGRHPGCRCPVLLRVGKHSQAVKPHFPDKIQKRSVILFLFPGESGDQSSAQADVGHHFPEHSDLLSQFLSVGMPSHPPEYFIGSVLDRHIDIVQDLRNVPHGLSDLFRDLLGIAVHQTDPLDPRYVGKFPEKFGKRLVSVQVSAVKRRLLRHQDQFPDSLRCQKPRLFQQLLHRNASVATTDGRDDTVGAAFVAPFGDLEIAVIASGGDNALCGRSRPFVLAVHQKISA